MAAVETILEDKTWVASVTAAVVGEVAAAVTTTIWAMQDSTRSSRLDSTTDLPFIAHVRQAITVFMDTPSQSTHIG